MIDNESLGYHISSDSLIFQIVCFWAMTQSTIVPDSIDFKSIIIY